MREKQRNTLNPFMDIIDREFIKMFRVSKSIFRYLIDRIKPLMTEAQRSTALPAEIKILCALRFFSTGISVRLE